MKSKLFQLERESEIVPVLRGDDLQIAIHQTEVRKRFKGMLELPTEFKASLFNRINRDSLITVLEQFTVEDIADFMIVAVYQMGQEIDSLYSEIDHLEDEVEARS